MEYGFPSTYMYLKIEEYKEGIDVFALAYRNHTDDHYMVADR